MPKKKITFHIVEETPSAEAKTSETIYSFQTYWKWYKKIVKTWKVNLPVQLIISCFDIKILRWKIEVEPVKMLDSTIRFLHHKMLIIEIVCNSWGRFFFALLNDGTYIFPFEKTSANAFKHHWASINFFSRLNVFLF